jgi:penicillin-binding protein 2
VIRGQGGQGRRLGAGVDPAVEERVPLLAVLMLLVFAVFAVRLFQLQIIESDALRLRSQRNSVRTVRLEAPRGDVLDREGRVLATTRPAFGLQAIPNDLRDSEVTFAALGMLLDEDGGALRARVGSPRGRQRFTPVRLAGDLSYDRLARVESHLYALPGVVTDVRPRRYYPAGPLAAHVLGSIGEIGPSQLATREFADYRQGEVIGLTGVEARYQRYLRGRAGGRNQVVDVSGRVVEVLDEVEPQPGVTVTLTLDLDLQQAAEAGFLPEVLGEPAKLGALVALDPRNGDVLALVSKPSYDPNAFAGGIDAETWGRLTNDEWRPLQNRALAGLYPPGSTYKAIVAAAGLQEGVIDPEEPFTCSGSFKLGRRTYRCWKRHGHGEVDLRKAIVESCDVYFYRVGLELGIDRLAFFANGFNLGRLSGIRIPQEKSGLVPTEAWKEKRHAEPWILGETVSAAIGQGYNLATPLQMAVAYAALANGGKLPRPRLLLRATGRDGSVTEGPPPEVLGKVPVALEHLARIRDGLEGAVSERGGTGGRARVRGVRVAGKTGTAQVVRLEHTENLEEDEVPVRYRDHAWFVSFAPVDAPEIVVAALVEHGGHGGSAAAPIARRLLDRYFEKRQDAEAVRVAGAPEADLADD